MSDENDNIPTEATEPDDLFDEGNIVKMPEQIPESDPVIDCAVLLSQREQLKQQVRDMERDMQRKQYELDLNGGLARLNVAGDILTGYAAAGHLPTLAGETRLQAALRYADELCTDFETKMEKRAAEFVKTVAMSPSDEINPAGREN